jgi:phage-related protein
MDKKVLDALNNLSLALEQIAAALYQPRGNKDSGSEIVNILKSGNLITQIKSIDEGVKQLRKDSKEIIKNQETILNLSKQKQNENSKIFEDTAESNRKSKVKDGIGTVLLIASGVLAIGLAFKLIGTVDFASVIALSISLPLIAMAFDKIGSMKNISIREVGSLVITVLALSSAITLSSFILSRVRPIGLSQLATTILIAGAFTLISYNIGKLMEGLRILKPTDIIRMALLPIILVGVSGAIALSSILLQLVKPISLPQLVTTIAIAAAFAVLSSSIGKMITGIGSIKSSDIPKILLLPLILTALSGAIVASSMLLQFVKPLSFEQFVTTIALSAAFVIMSYGLPKLSKAIENINYGKILMIPLVYISLSLAIMASSFILKNTQPIPPGLLFNIILQSISISIMGLVMGFAVKFLGEIPISTVLIGSLSIVILAAALMVSSLLLNLGTYKNYPSISWSLSFSLSMLLLAIPVAILGLITLPVVVMGALGLIVIAAAITAASYILSKIDPKFFYVMSDAVSYFVMAMAKAISYGLKVIAPALKIFIDTVGDSLIKFVKNILPPIVSAVSTLMKDVFEPLGRFIQNILPVITSFLSEVLDKVIPLASKLIDGLVSIANIIKDIFQIIGDTITNIGNTIVKIIDAIGNSISKVIDSMSGFVTSIGTSTEKVINSVVGGIERLAAVGTWDLAKAAVKVGSFLASIATSIGEFTIASKGSDEISKATSLLSGLSNTVSNIASSVNNVSGAGSVAGVITSLNSLSPNTTNLDKVSAAIDRMGKSIKNLNSSIDEVNLDKLNALKTFTGSIVLLSLMDSDQFEKMMDTLESKSKTLFDAVNSITKEESVTQSSSVSIKSPTQATNQPSLKDVLEVMARMDGKLQQIVKSNDNLSKYVDEIRTSDLKVRKK